MKEDEKNHIVWIDMEMTGLDINTCHILEVACLITDQNLTVISEEFNVVIHQSDEILNSMNAWCKEHHCQSGLVQESRLSKTTVQDAEKMLLEFCEKYVTKGTCPMAGSTIYMDRLFLYKYMPLMHDYLHYRVIDVSSIKELMRRWNPVVYETSPKKDLVHRALPDIRESINELLHYKKHGFI